MFVGPRLGQLFSVSVAADKKDLRVQILALSKLPIRPLKKNAISCEVLSGRIPWLTLPLFILIRDVMNVEPVPEPLGRRMSFAVCVSSLHILAIVFVFRI